MQLLHHLIENNLSIEPNTTALLYKQQQITYQQLWLACGQVAEKFSHLALEPGSRIAVYLPKLPETIFALFGASVSGMVFVPVNPLLKPAQVAHILQDSGATVLITSCSRARQLSDKLASCGALHHLICIDASVKNSLKDAIATSVDNEPELNHICFHDDLGLSEKSTNSQTTSTASPAPITSQDIAAILYTSGSTGKPKGVVLTHENLLAGAQSVASYLNNHQDDRLLALLPLSFDYGLNQITSAFFVGASTVLMDFFFPRDVIKAFEQYQITGLAAVPPLWQQLSQLDWPETATKHLRYFTNSGGAMPGITLNRLRALFPQATPFLMYGLTEAFRSTYLDPAQIEHRSGSIGKAIPGAEILVLNPDLTECAENEIGELVHLGVHVAKGYWQDEEKTRQKFKPLKRAGRSTETAVWSGDQVYRDEEGYLYFVARADEMIKTSGYRVSPEEIEEILLQHPQVEQAVALGAPHPTLDQAIVVVVTELLSLPSNQPSNQEGETEQLHTKLTSDSILKYCKQQLPGFMVPQLISIRDSIPKNANGKLDRAKLKYEFKYSFVNL